MRNLLCVCAAVVSIAAFGSTQRTLNVPANYPTIQAAIRAAAPNDTVLVAPGTYRENVSIGQAITVRSSHGPDLTTIDGSAVNTVVRMTAPATLPVVR